MLYVAIPVLLLNSSGLTSLKKKKCGVGGPYNRWQLPRFSGGTVRLPGQEARWCQSHLDSRSLCLPSGLSSRDPSAYAPKGPCLYLLSVCPSAIASCILSSLPLTQFIITMTTWRLHALACSPLLFPGRLATPLPPPGVFLVPKGANEDTLPCGPENQRVLP